MPEKTIRNNAMTVDRCLDWCLLAYAETRSRGFYVASRFEGIRGTDILNACAFKVKLVLDNPQGKGRVWKELLEIPKLGDASKLFNAYEDYQAEGRRKTAARAKIKQDALAAATQKPELKPESVLKIAAGDNTTKGRLTRIEAKLEQLLSYHELKK